MAGAEKRHPCDTGTCLQVARWQARLVVRVLRP